VPVPGRRQSYYPRRRCPSRFVWAQPDLGDDQPEIPASLALVLLFPSINLLLAIRPYIARRWRTHSVASHGKTPHSTITRRLNLASLPSNPAPQSGASMEEDQRRGQVSTDGGVSGQGGGTLIFGRAGE
jgi:hypothetical protein